jgi:putative SOS response-associated peptidase YedK
MCFNKANHERKQGQLEKRYGVNNRPPDKLVTYYHESGFEHLEAPVITAENPGMFSFYRWGIIPRWQKNRTEATQFWNHTLNAVSEEVFEKPSYRDCILRQRCIVPVTGFYEHMDYRGKKYPHYIHLKNQEYFSLAGIYERWTDPLTQEIWKTYSILTCEANPLIAKIHNLKKRMPVIYPKRTFNLFLNLMQRRRWRPIRFLNSLAPEPRIEMWQKYNGLIIILN